MKPKVRVIEITPEFITVQRTIFSRTPSNPSKLSEICRILNTSWSVCFLLNKLELDGFWQYQKVHLKSSTAMSLSRNHKLFSTLIHKPFCEQFHVRSILFFTKLHRITTAKAVIHSWRPHYISSRVMSFKSNYCRTNIHWLTNKVIE